MISPERLIEYNIPLTPEEAEEVRRGYILLGEVLSYMDQSAWLNSRAPTALVHEAYKLVQETFIL